jgi:hypothetical protein
MRGSFFVDNPLNVSRLLAIANVAPTAKSLNENLGLDVFIKVLDRAFSVIREC